MTNCSLCNCGNPLIASTYNDNKMSFIGWCPKGRVSTNLVWRTTTDLGQVKASTVDSYEGSSNFVKRMEQAWLISQQPTPVVCTSCNSNGYVECKWCAGTGFFILGDNMLCQVPSRNSTCVICAGKGSMCCSDCKGTGFRAKWLEEPPTSK